jgi:hypothetical protein
MSHRFTRRLSVAITAAILVAGFAIAASANAAQTARTVANPYAQNQMMPFSKRSYWLQPWRSYQDTFPATRMLNAVGVNFNIYNGNVDQITAGAKLMHDAGFTHGRIEIPWNMMDYQNPDQLSKQELSIVRPVLQQFKANGIRPLILLNSNDGIPCPVQNVTLNVTASAAEGATQVQLDKASAALVRPGYTGFKQFGRDAGVIITSVSSSGMATLSQPLHTAIPAGAQAAATLKFQPFYPPANPDGSNNANNVQTVTGWLEYVAGVTQTVKSILGNDNFDVEVWNELTFGSAFLSASNYYKPAPKGFGPITRQVLGATVDYIRDSQNDLPDVGIGDGFANETPFMGGGAEIPGVTAIDKHPYMSALHFPSAATFNTDRPLDALGNPAGTQVNGQWHDSFIPTFTSLFPEYFLTGIQTETVTHDLAPWSSNYQGGPHGRDTHPSDAPAPSMWVTEVNEDASTVHNTLTSQDGKTTSPMSAADLRHFESKAILRYLSSWVGKGTKVIDFYALANAKGLNLADQSFFNTAWKTHTYPGLAAAGETMVDVQRFLATMSGAQYLSSTTPLSLTSVTNYDNAYQFAGNGTANYPALYNRDMVGFFPFQVTAHKWVIPTYVMTLNMATLYNTSAPATDVTRQDMPGETFSLTINGVNGATATAAAVDPLSGSSVPATITGRTSSSVTVQIPLTDSPRMLTLQDS